MASTGPDATRCAQVSRLSGEALVGTASPVQAWLLMEAPGAWARDAVADVLSRSVAPDTAQRVLDLHRHRRLRPLLIRRPGRTPPAGALTVFVGVATPEGGWLERLRVDSLAGLADLDLEALADGRPGHGTPVAEPLLLVCTHGTKDLCCAVDGRPLAATLAATFGDAVWECSHVGGDRFAGNLVVVPSGEYHGRVDAAAAVDIATEAMAGRVRLQHLRGRAAYDPWQQAAEAAVRASTGLLSREDVVCGPSVVDATGATVQVATAGGAFRVRVERKVQASQPLSRCRGPLTPLAHVVTDLVALPAALAESMP